MKNTLVRLALLALPLLPATAAVNPAIVPADARWMIYADLNSLRTSTIGKELLTLTEKAQVSTPGGKIGFDWQKVLATVGTATAYGSNISPKPNEIDGALLVQGTADLRKIAESLLIQANLAHPDEVIEVTDLPFPAYALHPKNGAEDGTKKLELMIAFPPEPVVIVSKSKAQILKARDVFKGSAPSLAKGPDSPLKRFVSGAGNAYLFAASVVPAEKFFPEDGPQARIVKMANAGSLALGEQGDNTFARAELIASSDQMADKLMKIVQGMTAMMSLAETNDQQLAEFLSSAAVSREGDAVSLKLSYSSARLAQMIKGLQQREPAQDRAVAQRSALINGKSLAEWQSDPAAEGAATAPALAVRTIENVALKSGSLITLARQTDGGGRDAHFDRIEIVPVDGAGAPLVFRAYYLRSTGPRGNWLQLEFPGGDGTYNLKVAYINDASGKTSYAVSLRDAKPGPAAPAPEPKKAP